MSDRCKPLVSVVTPVFNGERYLAECIESVLAQTHSNFEYVIVNNQSNDRTRQIADCYAAKDPRIRVVDTPAFFKIIDNWNYAIRQIDPSSKYCKELHSDDVLHPQCLEQMIAVAEAHPNVGIVGCYVRKGNHIVAEFPYSETAIDGREVCARTLQRDFFAFGSPSSLLIRSDVVRARNPFYDNTYYHADTEACYATLASWDFGFVYQILSVTRLHDESVSSTFTDRMRTNYLEWFGMFRTYGPKYLAPHAYEQRRRRELKSYYRFLARTLVFERNREFWRFHRAGLERMGYRFNHMLLARGFWWLFAEYVFNPKRTAGRIVRYFRDRREGALGERRADRRAVARMDVSAKDRADGGSV